MKKRTVSRLLTTMLSSAMIATQMGAPTSVMAAGEETIDVEETEEVEEDYTEVEDTLECENHERIEGGVAINSTNFPDPVFREYIKERDYTRDGTLSEEEINDTYEIIIQDSNLKSLKGIEVFSELENLIVTSTKLTELDLSNNPKLYYVDCCFNEITYLNIGNKPYLIDLYCQGNELSSLDISNCPALLRLDCSDNKLTSIDISKNPSLDVLDCQYNKISKIDLSHNQKLTCLSCYANNISTLDISNVDMLKRVYNEGFDNTKSWLDYEEPQKHYTGKPNAIWYELHVDGARVVDNKWFVFAFDKSTQLVTENKSNPSGNDTLSNTFAVGDAQSGVAVIDGSHTLSLEKNAKGNFVSAKITGANGSVDKSIDSYVANIVMSYNEIGNPSEFYSLVFTDGEWDTSYDSGNKGAYEYKGVDYFVAGGVVNQNANGLIYTGADGWKFLAAGHVVTGNAGLVMYQDRWFWIDNNGSCDDSYAAIVNWNGGQFFVHGGRLRTDFTGFAYDPQNTGRWYHITNGQVWGDGVITDQSIEGGMITRNVVAGVVQ